MNSKQRVGIVVGLTVALLMAIFPPWTVERVSLVSGALRTDTYTARTYQETYSPIFAPPRGGRALIAWDRLALQWVAVALGCCTAVYLLGKRRSIESE